MIYWRKLIVQNAMLSITSDNLDLLNLIRLSRAWHHVNGQWSVQNYEAIVLNSVRRIISNASYSGIDVNIKCTTGVTILNGSHA